MNADNVTLRDLTEEDIPAIVDYWFHSPPGYITGLGIDFESFPKESEFEAQMRAKCRASERREKPPGLMILLNGNPIGMHTIYPVTPGDFGVFHAHIFKPGNRGQGVAMISYVKAAQVFMERFQLKRILYKTPLQNLGAIRVKEKLGIRSIGSGVIDFAGIKPGTQAKIFELLPEELNRLIDQMNSKQKIKQT